MKSEHSQYHKEVIRMTEKRIEDNMKCFIEAMNKAMEGKIHVDEFGGRWIFRNGRWQGLCYVEPLKSDLHD